MIEHLPSQFLGVPMGIVGSAETLVAAAVARGQAPAEALTAVRTANRAFAASRGGTVDRANPTRSTNRTPEAAAPASAQPIPAAPSQPRWIAPNLKAFSTAAEAYRAGMALLAGVGKATGNRNLPAEVYCRQHGVNVVAIATTLSPGGGAYLLPDELSEAIITLKSRVGFARKLAFISPMTSKTQAIPWEISGLQVEYIGETLSMAPAASDIEWGQIGLEARKRGLLSYVSNELRDDALINFVDLFVDRVGHALAKVEDQELILGDGTSDFGGEVGLLSSIGAAGIHTAAAGHDSFAEIDLDDILSMMALLPEEFADGRESFIASAAFHAIAMTGAVNGAYQGVAPDGTPLFLGKKVHVMPAMPSASAASAICLLYGNWSEVAMLGDRGIKYAVSEHTPDAFEHDLTAVRVFSRYDLQVHNAGDGDSAGGYVALQTAA